MTDAIQASATRQREVAHIAAAHFRDQLFAARARLAEVGIGSVERRRVRERIAQLEADIADAEDEVKRLTPAVEAEVRQAEYDGALRDHNAALANCDATLAAQSRQLNREIDRLVMNVGILARNCAGTAAMARLNVSPNAVHQPVPLPERFVSILIGRLCAAGHLDADTMMPSRYAMSELSPLEMIAKDSPEAAVAELQQAIASNPPRSPAALAREAAQRDAQRKQREAELRKPLPKLPAPAPMRFGAGR
ncbi:hypothetical protein [Roseomonas sp. CECT 9278]|uniref:hypothetical protein n=1 Tax=Roseomonas sp. CECT 9278 TaxID=2845823 RepID=UPI001E32A963|nr:hypothetical protein [Roseomonas sp. CECT 9278]CAH0161880.1 hypothetical protein ROS9278_00981 [Roseomonas sp. CECT 9278]